MHLVGIYQIFSFVKNEKKLKYLVLRSVQYRSIYQGIQFFYKIHEKISVFLKVCFHEYNQSARLSMSLI